jgi:hypothetical protein
MDFAANCTYTVPHLAISDDSDTSAALKICEFTHLRVVHRGFVDKDTGE